MVEKATDTQLIAGRFTATFNSRFNLGMVEPIGGSGRLTRCIAFNYFDRQLLEVQIHER